MQRRLLRLIAALFALTLVAGSCGGSDQKPTLDESAASPGTLDPAVTGCDPRVDRFPYHVAFAKNQGDLAIYANPGDPVPTTAMANPRMTDSDPPIPVDLGFLVKAEPKEDGCEWINVYLPVRPNGSSGWVKREDVRVEGHVWHIEVRLAEFNLKVFEGDKVILDTQIGTAKDNSPTPGGLYYTTELLATGDPDSLYGPYAYGLSGYSEVYTSFNGGQGQLGIHGTNEPEKIGQQVSAGCIRLRNEDIEFIVEKFGQDSIGIPVQVFA